MPDIPMTSKIARKPWSIFNLESAMTRFVSKTNARFVFVSGLRNCSKKREERQGAGGCGTEMSDEVLGGRGGGDGDRDKERSIRRTTLAVGERGREREGGGEERPHSITALSSR